MARAAKSLKPSSSAPRLLLSRTESAGRRLYHTRAWKTLRKRHLAQHPYCVQCVEDGVPASRAMPRKYATVDHIRPHRGDPVLFFDQDNLQTLCHSHHSRKNAARDGGFGNQRRE